MSPVVYADRIPPPPKTESFQEQYRWNYRVFELLNGNLLLPGRAIEPFPEQLMYSDESSSKVAEMDGRIREIERVMKLTDVASLSEIRRELNELKKMLVMEV